MTPSDASWSSGFTGEKRRPGRPVGLGLVLAVATSIGLWILIIAALRAALS